LLEANAHYSLDHAAWDGLPAYKIERFSWHRIAFSQLWILVLYLVYGTAAEFNALFGRCKPRHILFTQGSTKMKLTRRPHDKGE
jgi:hypothetical protein